MSATLPEVAPTLRFPVPPPAQMSLRRRWWQWCVLRGISPLRFFGPAARHAAGILTYHRVADNVGPDPLMLNVSPRRFRQQIAGLLRLGYQPLALRSLIEMQRQRRPFPTRTFAVTLDDGYSDNFRNAWPVLREFNVPATIFLATRYLDSDKCFPFVDWPQEPAATTRPLSMVECHEMLASGLIELGAHTHSHEDFRDRPAQFRVDLQRSHEVLREKFGIESPTFAFPYGFASCELTNIVRDMGLACGLTVDCQLLTARDDPFRWGRFGASELDTAWTLAAKLDGWYSTCQNVYRAARRMGKPRTTGDG